MKEVTSELLGDLRIVALRGGKCDGCGLCDPKRVKKGDPVDYRVIMLSRADGRKLKMRLCGTKPTLEIVTKQLRFYAACSTDVDKIIEDGGYARPSLADAAAEMAKKVREFLSRD